MWHHGGRLQAHAQRIEVFLPLLSFTQSPMHPLPRHNITDKCMDNIFDGGRLASMCLKSLAFFGFVFGCRVYGFRRVDGFRV